MLLPPAALGAELELYSNKNKAGSNFTLPDLKDKTHALSDYRGKVVLVNFWASWCLPCLYEMPSMQKLANALSEEDFEIVTINISDTPRRIRETLKRLQLALTVLQDPEGKTYKAWQGEVLPTSFLLDRNGKVRYRAVGPIEWDDADVLLKIRQLI
ncbi:MAG: redoxin domain-containing protein [Gammaproteobacteria bacterium]|nr:redoxin domain-containing protein [Gammaproteobacteria bacterium]